MSEEITPALTAEEWETWQGMGYVDRPGLRLHTKGRGFYGLQRVSVTAPHPADEECHAIAAAMLYGQPFGFTAQDVANLRELQIPSFSTDELKWRDSLASRIAALLPPDGA